MHILRQLYENRLRMWRSGIFVLKITVFYFYDAHSKTVMKDYLRMWHGGISVIIENLNDDGFQEKTAFIFLPL